MSAYRRQYGTKYSERAKDALRAAVGKAARLTPSADLRRKLPSFSPGDISELRTEKDVHRWERLLMAAEALGVSVEIRVGDQRIAA